MKELKETMYKAERYLNVVKTEDEKMELSVGGNFIERMKLIWELLTKGKIVFGDWTWFGEDEE